MKTKDKVKSKPHPGPEVYAKLRKALRNARDKEASLKRQAEREQKQLEREAYGWASLGW